MSGRPRPLRVDAARNRELLLDVARQVFAELGLEVPIDEIARRADLGIGTVYRHFPKKEALFEAIILDQLERFLAQTDVLHRESDAEKALVQFLERYMAAGAAKRDFLEALSRGRLGFKPTPALRKVFKRIRDSLGVLLSRAQEAGAVRSDVGVEEVLALLHSVTGFTGPPEGRSRLLAVVLDGLRGRGASAR
jgi:AcrR family transcriptional regulator